MKTPHKHAEVIKAWADGEIIQVKQINGEWGDIHNPIWNAPEYRVKPEGVKYRRFLVKVGGKYFVGVSNEEGVDIRMVEKGSHFVKWIDTDWQEVEV